MDLYNILSKSFLFKVSLALAIGVVVGAATGIAKFSGNVPIRESQFDSLSQTPNPNLSPDDVVRLQLEALQRSAQAPEAFADCFAFASPSNRRIVGRLDQFQSMLEASYPALIGYREVLVGRASVDGLDAHVLVTGIDANGISMGYEFFLSKQTHIPYRDCWMTDSVFPVISLNALQSSSQQSVSDEIEPYLSSLR